MTDRLVLEFAPREHRFMPKGEYWYDPPRWGPRQGVCLHYDGSSSDLGGLGWLQSVQVHASYNLVVLDDGSWGVIAPLHTAAWHCGVSRPSSAFSYPPNKGNDALYGLAILSSGHDDVTPRQLLTVAWLTARLFAREGWPIEQTWRVTTHRAEAWERGRKSDPEGADLRNPIMSAEDVRALLPLFKGIAPLTDRRAA